MKTILCFGDSNTYGYIPGSGKRYDTQTRWPRVLAGLLGDGYDVIEEGLSGRTTAFRDLIEPGRCGLDTILPCAMSHEPLDLIILMLGTNDTKSRFHVTAQEIGYGMEELIMKIGGYYHYREGMPQILLVSPVPLGDMSDAVEFNEASRQKSLLLADIYRQIADAFHCHFLDAGAVTGELGCDGIHLTPRGHAALAQAVAEKIRSITE